MKPKHKPTKRKICPTKGMDCGSHTKVPFGSHNHIITNTSLGLLLSEWWLSMAIRPRQWDVEFFQWVTFAWKLILILAKIFIELCDTLSFFFPFFSYLSPASQTEGSLQPHCLFSFNIWKYFTPINLLHIWTCFVSTFRGSELTAS